MIRTSLGRFTMVAALGGALIACSADATSTTDEDLKDSFNKPTMHGELLFGSPNQAEFTDEARFHAWTFTLNDKASVELTTKLITQNLDSEIYLYKRVEGSTAWGESIAKNDDTQDTLASRIKRKLDAGEYMLKVKAKKELLRGHFGVEGMCSGKGCPKPDANIACTPGTFDSIPAATNFTASCASKLRSVMTEPVTATAHTSTVRSKKCDVGGLESRGVDYYVSYWMDMIGWEDFADERDGDEERDISLEIQRHGSAGTMITADIGGDEDALSMIFDGQGNLLSYYQHNQSPDWGWTCGEQGEQDAGDPGEKCASHMLWLGDSLNASPMTGTTTAKTAATDLSDPSAGQVAARFAQTAGITDADSIDYSVTTRGDHAVQLTLTAGKTSITYDYYSNETAGAYLVFETNGGSTTAPCTELP